MKLITLLILALPMVAQTVVNPASLTFSADGITAANTVILLTQTISPNGSTPVRLAGSIDAVTLTVTVTDASNLKANDSLFIDAEAMPIASKVGNVITLTSRADLGTTAAIHATQSIVQTLLYPSIKKWITGTIAAAIQTAIDNCATCTVNAAQNAVISTAQAAKQAAKASAVQ